MKDIAKAPPANVIQKKQPFFRKQEDNAISTNRKSDAFFKPSAPQAKRKVGEKGDKFEQQADAMANRVMSIEDDKVQASLQPETITPFIKKKEEEEAIQQKPAFESPGVNESVEADELPLQEKDNKTTVQAKDVDSAFNHSNIESSLKDSRGGGEQLPKDTQAKMESGIGADFGSTRVHTGVDAVQMNRDLNSQAFTSGNDIYFNEGKYNPGTKEGDHLLAHELTHTIQQGASETKSSSVQSKTNDEDTIQKQEQNSTKSAPGESTKILTPVDISTAFKPNPAMAAYLDEKGRKKPVDVPVKMGKLASGFIKVKQRKPAKETTPAVYQIQANERQGIPFNGIDFLNPLKSKGIEPVIALNAANPEKISGFISLRINNTVIGNPKSLILKINDYLEPLGLLGIKKLSAPGLTNKVENGIITLNSGELKTTVAEFLDASGSFGLVGERFNFEINTHVDVKGLVQGDFKIARDEKGQFLGEGEIAVAIKNVSGKVKATYINGDVTILGTVGIESEKFSGSVTIMVADKGLAQQTMLAALDVKTFEDEIKKKPSPKKAKRKTKTNQVIIGWGTVKATITPWLEGTAKVGVDDKGQVTIVGKIEVPNEVELMEQKGKKVTLFELEIKAGYGIPLVGQVGLFASIGMFVSAGFGPLVLRNVGFTGTYSTDPSVLQKFTIIGTLGISAFAIIGLEAKAGVFVTIIGHDIKAGIKVTAAAGIKAYAEVTPTFEYIEKASPEGGKVGEAWLKGHFEAAAQLFLKLAGSFFVEIDAPWWSPVPDKTWDYPVGDVEYPIGPSMGIGGDVAWLIGSPEVPELKFSPVDFDPDKFTSDIMADPPPGKGGGKGGKQKGEGKWEDKAQKGGKKEKPELQKDNKGLEGKKKEDPAKWPDEKRYMRALGEIGKIGDASMQAPITFSVLDAKLKKIKQKYRINKINTKNKKDGSVKVYVKHAKQNNNKNLIEIKLMSEAERQKLVELAKKDLETKQALKVDAKAKTIMESDAKAVAAEVAGKHKVAEAINIVDGKDTWDYELDLGDKKEEVNGVKKGDIKHEDIFSEEKTGVKFTSEDKKESHTIYADEKGDIPVLLIKSTPEPISEFLTYYEKKHGDSLTNYKKGKLEDAKKCIVEVKDCIEVIDDAYANNKSEDKMNLLFKSLLEKNIKLSGILKSLLGDTKNLKGIKEKHALEGQTGTYASIPKPPGDDFTGDHQPQASILIWSAKTSGLFESGSNMDNLASGGHADNAKVVNLHKIRHKAGRTYGNKGKDTKKKFVGFVTEKISKEEVAKPLILIQDKKDIVVDRIKEELSLDIKEMKTVVQNDENWTDIKKLGLEKQEEDKLKEDITNQIDRGEKELASQDLDSLKK